MKLQSKVVFLRLTAVFLALFLGCMLVFAGCGGGDTPGGDNGSDNGNEGQTDGDSDGDDPDEGGTDFSGEKKPYDKPRTSYKKPSSDFFGTYLGNSKDKDNGEE